MKESQAYTDSPKGIGSFNSGNGLVSGTRTLSSIENRLEILQKSINALGEDAHLFADRVKLVRRITPTVDTQLDGRAEPEEYTSELARVLSEMAGQINHISAFIKDATNELEL